VRKAWIETNRNPFHILRVAASLLDLPFTSLGSLHQDWIIRICRWNS